MHFRGRLYADIHVGSSTVRLLKTVIFIVFTGYFLETLGRIMGDV